MDPAELHALLAELAADPVYQAWCAAYDAATIAAMEAMPEDRCERMAVGADEG